MPGTFQTAPSFSSRDGRKELSLGVVLLVLVGCTDTKPASASFSVDPVGCPAGSESADGKIFHESYILAHPELTHPIAVTLRSPDWKPPNCAGQSGAQSACATLDAALRERQELNQREVDCVFGAFGKEGIKDVQALWYEPPTFLTTGRPVPIGTAFFTLAVSSQIEAVALHPYVKSIEPAFGEAARIGSLTPPVPTECPAATDEPEGKVADATGIQNQGRQPVVIELRESLLPPFRSCQSTDLCEELFSSGWSRTIAAQRMLTCVRRFLDSKLRGPAANVDFARADGLSSGEEPLPPFGSFIHAQTAFALTLTWDEVVDIARHPWVERLWTSSSLGADETSGCPPNYDEPVNEPTCPGATASTEGKLSAASMAAWAVSSGTHEVVIAVRREHQLCPQPLCPGRGVECPELTKYEARVTEEARASQRCVRALIATVGGIASPEVLVLGNAISASLTWAQIQAVAAHPDVLQIAPRETGTPPP